MSVADRDQLQRSNNALESYNHRLNAFVFPSPHPPVPEFVDGLKGEMLHFEKLIDDTQSGKARQPVRPPFAPRCIPEEYERFAA